MDGPLGGMAFANREQVQRIIAPLRPVPLRPLRWPCEQTRSYAGPGTVLQIGDDNEDWFEVYVGVRHRALLLPLRVHGLDWEHFTGQAPASRREHPLLPRVGRFGGAGGQHDQSR